MALEKLFDQVYGPLMDKFVEKLTENNTPVSNYKGIPHPFVPIWGKNYEKAFKKIAIVGKETRGWGVCLDEFLEKYKSGQYRFEQDRCEFRDLHFKDWGTDAPGSFWRFYMEVLADVYGIKWTEIKKGEYDCLIDDFVWGNTHAIETSNSEFIKELLSKQSSPGYNLAYNAAETILNKIDFLEKVFAPDVVIVTDAQYNTYLGKDWVCEDVVDGKIKVLKRGKTVVLQCDHPNGQRFKKGGTKEYARILRDLLCKKGFFFSLQGMRNKFIPAEEKETLVERMKKEPDKYEAIKVVALTLRKYGCIMSARDLGGLLNRAGFLTNRGGPFTGNCQGPYRIISATYKRARTTDIDVADAIACSFTKEDGSYAY